MLAVALSRKIGAEQFGIFSTTSTHAVVERPSLDHLLGTSEQRDWNVTPSALFILMTDTCRVTRALTTASRSLADVKARQSSKIREIGEALITAGFISLDAQAKATRTAPQHRLDHPLGGTQGHRALREGHLPDVEFEPAPP
jgi:hypothetical protein